MTDHEFRPPGTPEPSQATATAAAEPTTAGAPELEPGFWGGGGAGDEPPTDDGGDSASGPSRRGRGLESSLRTMIEWVAVAIAALAVALLIKAFLLQAFYIPSASMADTLEVDDRVLVNKLSYRIGDVDRGDIIVFEKPENAPGDIEDFIKRVIALPGETITFVDGDVFIDGQLLTEPYVDGSTNAPIGSIQGEGCTNTPAPDRCTVADGFYFVMGDNRDNSTDSRSFGPIDEDTIVGRAFLKVWPLGDLGFL
ncbi:MAG: signal peptidase I [Actinomycetota bacterium]